MQFAFACAVLLASWLLLRRQAGGGSWRLWPLDLAPIGLGWLLLLSLTARPLVAAVAVAALAAGLALTDAVKRATLREPLVFADRAELLEVVRHPRLYLPFAGPVRVVGGAVGAAALVALLVWLEPAAPHPSPLVMAPLTVACFVVPTWPPLLQRLARRYRRLSLTGDPAIDMRRTGLLACLVIQATLARAERTERRRAVLDFGRAPALGPAEPAWLRPVVLVQMESFFDARRLHPAIPRDLLPGFDRLRAGALQAGRLAVPCWGANTVRTEFAVLTGIDQDALGLDRFNPYERFAQARLRSVAWEMKRLGYRTICLHPFDKRFYARSRVMPQLGFDEFRGLEAFEGAARDGPYVADRAVGEAIARILRTEGPAVFVFAMTMGNHGPWSDPGSDPGRSEPGSHPALPGWAAALDGLPEAGGLRGFLAGLVAGDAMLAPMMDAMPEGGLLAIYGDHQPSLPAAFEALGVADERTDYALWRPGSEAGPPRDIRAEEMATTLLRAVATVDRAGADLR